MRRGEAVLPPTYPTIPHIGVLSGVSEDSTQRVERFAGFSDELVRVLYGRRFGYYSHDWFRSRGSNMHPTVLPRQAQTVLGIGFGVRKCLFQSGVDGVEA